MSGGPSTAVWFFHASRAARQRFAIRRELFASTANLIILDVVEVRALARRMGVPAGDLNAMGLIDEILHVVARRYCERAAPGAFGRALAHLEQGFGRAELDQALERFTDEFPPPPVSDGSETPASWLAGSTGGIPNREIAVEELLHLWLANANPAFRPFVPLFDETALAASTPYARVIESLAVFFTTEPRFGPDNEDLITLLCSPAAAFPHSLRGQLEYLARKLGYLIGDLLARLLVGLDVLREEERRAAWLGGVVQAPVPGYEADRGEIEAFSMDRDWMPRVVMIARNALVWLDQLSRFHGRAITRLDEVPDSELDLLARRGFSALWLIGVWERSGASREIKRRMGNPEAEASAYSLYDYEVATRLGGAEALANLRQRAWQRGIRLASDMVPNHTGIDSRWVVEHPDRFLGWPYADPPYPSYSYSGPDLSNDQRVGVRIEDHYWTRSDAAVVFRRVDRWTGDGRFIYHGNDGTHLPWNDTAQLDFLRADTREAVIEAIVRVARMFPIIRFDAAMTLTKRHYQRLWFPEPGQGGDIPSRAGQGMSREEFDRRMPREFWREVVDRVAREAPDTLLLAEAFWLLEGYFVRTLGMHRVYNSAFMNMLKAEENASYRLTIRNTLEFDPGVLERFVNFMSNPDEQTAIEQFGSGDKYFGVCTMMVTLPGLPMFAHGQVEGFREKYGMEFGRAYWDERPDAGMVERHEREIFPLLARRGLFARAERFLMYDLVAPEGWVNEDVFAYSNARESERALVLYNNSPRPARGRIRESTGFAEKTADGRRIARRSLADGLGLSDDGRSFVTFRDQRSGLAYIRSCREILTQGLGVALGPYGCQVFLDFTDVMDDEAGTWARLCGWLAGRGAADLGRAIREMELAPVRDAFLSALRGGPVRPFLAEATARAPAGFDLEGALARFAGLEQAGVLVEELAPVKSLSAGARLALRPWAFLAAAGPESAAWLEDWLLENLFEQHLRESGAGNDAASAAPELLRVLLGRPRDLFAGGAADRLLRVHEFEGARWFHKESFELLADFLALTGAVEAMARALGRSSTPSTARRAVSRALAVGRQLKEAGARSGWRWDVFRAEWERGAPSARRSPAGKPGASPAQRRSRRPPRSSRA